MSKDKLVAISGIVKRLQPFFKTDYLAGLWRDDLLEQLLWHVETYDLERRYLAGEQRPEYTAPSWSWASTDAPIVPQKIPNSNEFHMATIIEAHVTPVTDDITGQIENGYIRLRATLFPLQAEISEQPSHVALTWDWGSMECYNLTIPDVWPKPVVERLQFVPLLITLWPRPQISPYLLGIDGLILNPVEGKQGIYQRWGTTSLASDDERGFLNFGVQLTKGQRGYKYDPPERYPEQVITLI